MDVFEWKMKSNRQFSLRKQRIKSRASEREKSFSFQNTEFDLWMKAHFNIEYIAGPETLVWIQFQWPLNCDRALKSENRGCLKSGNGLMSGFTWACENSLDCSTARTTSFKLIVSPSIMANRIRTDFNQLCPKWPYASGLWVVPFSSSVLQQGHFYDFSTFRHFFDSKTDCSFQRDLKFA